MKADTIPSIGRRHAGRRNDPENGMIIIITLAFTALLMLLSTTLAITARTERRAAGVNADLMRSRMLAESALDRAVSLIRTEYAGNVYPGTSFYRPTESSAWHGRSYLASTNNDTAGIEDGLAVAFRGTAFTPAEELHPRVGWMDVTSTRQIGGTEQEVLIGRYAYAVIDESGKIDPGAAVSASEPEDSEARTGASPTEISLGDAGLSYPQRFRPRTVLQGAPGAMPDGGRWFSAGHIARALQPNQSQMNTMVKTLHPFSNDTEVFWRDADNDGVWDEGEDEDRLNLAGELNVRDLYDLFLGPDKTSNDDDCAWLKQLDDNSWVQSWRAANGLSTMQARQRMAAQIAANLVDYADADRVPTPAHVDATGEIQAGTTDLPGTYSIIGVEKTWGLTEAAIRVEADVILEPPPPGTCQTTGDVNVSPGSGRFGFVLDTPSGQITTATLRSGRAGFSYNGPATQVKLKVRGRGTSIVINGQTVTLDTDVEYTISCPDMTVNLRNLNPTARSWANAIGHWWIQIGAPNATITPDPGIPPPVAVPVALFITPGVEAEVFYPYGTGATAYYPPGTLSVSYTIQIETATGATGVAEGTVDVNMDASADVDGGTMVCSSGYTDGAVVAINNAFDALASPPLLWYRVKQVQITAVALTDAWGNVVDSAPIAAGGAAARYLCNWTQGGTHTSDQTYYASVNAVDALVNDRGEPDNDFACYWIALPDATHLATNDQAAMGELVGVGYDSADYCDVRVKNSGFARLGELGRVHSYQPMRSLRLWAATEADEVGHDADILDLFKIGPDSQKRGKININTLQSAVLEALFANATTQAAADAAAAVLAKRGSGTTFTNSGQLFGGVAGISGSTLASDNEEEDAIAKLAELVTVRQNYFTIIVCAQAMTDVAGTEYSTFDGASEVLRTAQYDVLDVSRDASGKVVRYIDPILAEQKLLAVVYRDAFSNQMRVERLQYIDR